jgi:hypothetical protein
MCDQNVLALVTEIRDLYSQQCTYADQIRELQEADHLRLMNNCRAREQPRIPELQYFTTVFDQQDALLKARSDPMVQARTKRLQTIAWVVIFTACIAPQLYPNSLGNPLWLTCGLVLMIVVTLIPVQHYWLQAPLCRNLRRQLIERGVPICLACGYDLRGQMTPRCPECGQPAEGLVSFAQRE